ncbi:MAG: ATP-binding protein [Bacteroidota bacterium]
MSDYIKKLVEGGENSKLDFKFEISDSRKIAKTLSAFSNTSGGKLLIGVKDNGKIAGIQSDEDFYMVQAAADLHTKPRISFTSKQHEVDNKIVLEIDIKKHDNIPVFAQNKDNKWLAYIRISDENKLVNKIQLNVWERISDSTGILFRYSEKEKILFNFLTENNSITFSKYCKIANLPRFEAEQKLTDLILLKIININYTDDKIYYSFNENLDLMNYKFGEILKQF